MDPKNATVPVFNAQIALELNCSSDLPCLSAQWLPYGAMNKVVASYAHGKNQGVCGKWLVNYRYVLNGINCVKGWWLYGMSGKRVLC